MVVDKALVLTLDPVRQWEILEKVLEYKKEKQVEDVASMKTLKIMEWSDVQIETTEECWDEDWKTALVKKKPIIPKGTKLKVEGVLHNYYGIYIETSYEGYHYSINPNNTKVVDCEFWQLTGEMDYFNGTPNPNRKTIKISEVEIDI